MDVLAPAEIADDQFSYITKLVRDLVGIDLHENKRSMVKGRLFRRMKALGLDEVEAYLEILRSGRADEVLEFVDAITTNVTHFFREGHHFSQLAEELLPKILPGVRGRGRLRIWSAGCSRGAEPYSIAMTLLGRPELAGLDVKILATDIDSKVLAQGREGYYEGGALEGLTPRHLKRHFHREGAGWRVKDELRRIVHFKRLNLMGAWPMRGPFDAIFCRNVVIYFDKGTQARLFARYAELLGEEGWLFLGHSESMVGTDAPFDLLGRSVYRKRGGPT